MLWGSPSLFTSTRGKAESAGTTSSDVLNVRFSAVTTIAPGG